MSDKDLETSISEVPPLARFAGAFLLAAALFALGAIVCYGTFGMKAPAGWAFTVLTGLCAGAYLFGRSQQERMTPDEFAKQRTLLGVNAVTSVLLIGVLLVGINYIAGRRQKTFDLTKNKANSLAQQSIEAIGKLKKPVALTYYYFASQPDAGNVALLESYARASDQLKVNYVNLGRTVTTPPAGFRGEPMVVAQEVDAKAKAPAMGAPAANSQEVSPVDEQNLTSALLKLHEKTQRKLYFLTDHGETDPSKLQQVTSALTSQNYVTAPVSLARKGAKVAPDASAVIVVGPQIDITPAELKTLNEYVASKGRLVLFLRPSTTKMPNWTALLKNLGISASEGVIMDFASNYAGSMQVPLAAASDAERHPILRGTAGAAVFPLAQVMAAVTPAPAGVTVTPLLESSAQSQAVSMSGGAISGQNPPFMLAAAVEKGNTRAFVSSSYQMTMDAALELYGTRSFLLSGINWAVGNDALVSIPPKPPVNNTLEAPQRTAVFFIFFSMLVLPAVALLIGAVVWFRRR